MGEGIRVVDQWAKLGHKRAKHWLFQVWDGRRRTWKSKAFEAKTDGWAWAEALRGRFALGQGQAGRLPFLAVAESYAQSLRARGLDAYHVRELELVADQVAAAGAVDLNDAAGFSAAVARWLATTSTLRANSTRVAGPYTRNRWLTRIKDICRHACRPPYSLGRSPLDGMRKSKVERKLKATLTVEQARAMVADDRAGDPFYLAACLMVYAGLRFGEALNMRWEAVNIDALTLHVQVRDDYRVKRSKERLAPLLLELREILIARRKPTGYIVDADRLRLRSRRVQWEAFRAYCTASGFDPGRLSPHSTRHTWAAMQLATGQNLSLVRRQLGHDDITTTDGYADAVEQYTAGVRGWPRGQLCLRRAPEALPADPLAFLREHVQGGGRVADIATAADLSEGELLTWLHDGLPKPVQQYLSALRAVTTASRGD